MLKRIAKNSEQILTINAKMAVEISKNFVSEIGGLRDRVEKIKINDEFGEYYCNKDFTCFSNGLLRMKFVLIKDDES